jgi:pimeloyl-ACP methyl ester carboxylesterase
LAALIFSLAPALVFAQDKFFDYSGVSMRYVDQEAGEPVILLHGIGGTLEQVLRPALLEALGLISGYRVLGFDARGHGKSGKPHDPAMYGRELGLDVVRLMDHLGIARAHVVGYSMGAATVSQLLTLRPERFLSATLVAGVNAFEWTLQMERTTEQEAIERERDGSEGGRAIAALMRGLSGAVITPTQAAAVKVPTLGIVGSLDPYMAGMRELKKLRPAMTLLVVEGATHGSILRQVQATSAIRESIASHRQSPPR